MLGIGFVLPSSMPPPELDPVPLACYDHNPRSWEIAIATQAHELGMICL